MNRTKIEWTDYTWNPVVGCSNGCSYCYARKMAKRFRHRCEKCYTFEPHLHEERLMEPFEVRKQSKIFVCSMGDLFDRNVRGGWIEQVLLTIRKSYHIYQILTKNPSRAIYYNFPRNSWLGTTAESNKFIPRINQLKKTNASCKFVSFEPLLTDMKDPFYGDYQAIRYALDGIDWIIIGSQTNPYRPPNPEWVEKLIEIARELGIAVFLKDNLKWPETIQEFPLKKSGGW